MGKTEGVPLRIGIEVFGTQTASRLRGIGRYSRDLLMALLAGDPVNEYILYGQAGLPDDQVPTAPNAETRMLRPGACGPTLAHAMERLVEENPDRLDILLLLNPLEMAPGYDLPARPLGGLKMAAVVYDLIPLLFQEAYFSRWPGPEFIRRYAQGLERLKEYDALLAISESTRRDVIERLGLAQERVVTIGTASDGRFFVPDWSEPMPETSRTLLSRLGIDGPFVFSVGSMEYRKNLWGLIDGFSQLPMELGRTHQLVLTYNLSGPERDRVRHYARDREVEHALVLTDRLEEPALRTLYQRCSAFVFPSAYEGFGLPVLEAMHCGAPVIAGNNSSQIEAVGDAGLLFDVSDAGKLAECLTRVLSDRNLSRGMGERAAARARRFRWEDSAEKTLEALGSAVTRPPTPSLRRAGSGRTPRRRVAFFSPLPPLKSTVAEYSDRLLEELGRRYAIDLYHDIDYLPHIGLKSDEYGCHDHRLFPRNSRVLGYHAVIYQMANCPYHSYITAAFRQHPGIVVLHGPSLASLPLDAGLLHQAEAVILPSSSWVRSLRERFTDHRGEATVIAIGESASEGDWAAVCDAYEAIIERVAAQRARKARDRSSSTRPRLRSANIIGSLAFTSSLVPATRSPGHFVGRGLKADHFLSSSSPGGES